MSSETQTFYADPEHAGIQTAVPLIFIGGLVVAYFLCLWLMPLLFGGIWANYLLLGGCAAVPIAMGIMLLADAWLKRVWHSGQTVHLSDTEIALHRPHEDPLVINLTQPYQVLRWYYQLGNWTKTGRERQIKNGWFCHTLDLKQDDQRITLFAFMPGHESNDLRAQASFKQLDVAQLHDTSLAGRFQAYRSASSRPEIPGSLLIGEDRAYWRGERERWQHGRELTPEDFQRVLTQLPKQPPKTAEAVATN